MSITLNKESFLSFIVIGIMPDGKIEIETKGSTLECCGLKDVLSEHLKSIITDTVRVKENKS